MSETAAVIFQANALARRGHVDEAKSLLASELARDPDQTGVLHTLAYLELSIDNTSHALALAQRCVEISGGAYAELILLVDCLRFSGQWRQAEDAARACLAMAPDDTTSMLLLANCLMAQTKAQTNNIWAAGPISDQESRLKARESRDLMRRAQELAPDDHWGRLLTGQTLLMDRSATGAISTEHAGVIAERLLSEDPDDQDAHRLLVRAHSKGGNLGRAVTAGITAARGAPGRQASVELPDLALQQAITLASRSWIFLSAIAIVTVALRYAHLDAPWPVLVALFLALNVAAWAVELLIHTSKGERVPRDLARALTSMKDRDYLLVFRPLMLAPAGIIPFLADGSRLSGLVGSLYLTLPALWVLVPTPKTAHHWKRIRETLPLFGVGPVPTDRGAWAVRALAKHATAATALLAVLSAMGGQVVLRGETPWIWVYAGPVGVIVGFIAPWAFLRKPMRGSLRRCAVASLRRTPFLAAALLMDLATVACCLMTILGLLPPLAPLAPAVGAAIFLIVGSWRTDDPDAPILTP